MVTCQQCETQCMHPMVCSGLDKCVFQNAAMPKTSKEKQEDYRARQALLGMKEVRGIYAPEHLHAAIKQWAQKLVAAREKEDRRD